MEKEPEFETEILKAILDIHEILQILSQAQAEINSAQERIAKAIETLADKMGYEFSPEEDASA